MHKKSIIPKLDIYTFSVLFEQVIQIFIVEKISHFNGKNLWLGLYYYAFSFGWKNGTLMIGEIGIVGVIGIPGKCFERIALKTLLKVNLDPMWVMKFLPKLTWLL